MVGTRSVGFGGWLKRNVEAGDEHGAVMAALHRSQAIIEFAPNGEILGANENFLSTFGYTLDEIVGSHHRIFVDPAEVAEARYGEFWEALGRGDFQSGEFRRQAKNGDEVWIQASYNPVLDDEGRVVRIVKFASDITAQKKVQREIQDRTQGVIEFSPDGTILKANQLFLDAVGYSLAEIQGQHHRIFMPPGEADTPEYQQFWPSLARGELKQGEFRRVDSKGRHHWLYGAYNPVLDRNGAVIRVVKNVTDITDQVLARIEADEVGHQIAESVSQMTAAIGEITSTTTDTASLAQEAESNAGAAADKVGGLDSASATIGDVLGVIQRLSDQTNLLALNATIEAARAGDAGQGFAVVANEVKLLATQTSDAASDIGASVGEIQGEIAGVVDVIEAIATSITRVSDMTTTVASALEEQASLASGINGSAARLLAISRAD